MLTDLRLGIPEIPAADVLIVGAGAAGISLARRLAGAGRSVCLLESGGLDFEADTQDLYSGSNIGAHYYDLVDARLRFFGGTTNIWGGRCTPLDPIDFAPREWVPGSGWPIDEHVIEPYYRAVHDELGLGEYRYDNTLWQTSAQQPPDFATDAITTRFWRFDRVKERFSVQRCKDIVEHPRIQVLLHANAVHLQASQDANAIRTITVATLAGERVNLAARTFVLACGGLENPRLLLASNDIEKAGIGNRHDQVGRYFMEHLHGRAARIFTDDPFKLWHAFSKRVNAGVPIAPVLLAGASTQMREGILNTAYTLKLQRDPHRGLLLNDRIYRRLKHQLSPDRSHRRLWHTYRDVRGWIQRHVKPVIERFRTSAGQRGLYLMIRAEQAPNPASRVVLDGCRDALGMPRLALDWHLSTLDKESVARMCGVFDTQFKRLGIGRVVAEEWLSDPGPEWPYDPTVSKHPIGGYHHIGTTRMSSSPQTGVVDAQCRVHGYANLFVAGSSVFPTSGWANPTLTILALGARLADHLEGELCK